MKNFTDWLKSCPDAPLAELLDVFQTDIDRRKQKNHQYLPICRYANLAQGEIRSRAERKDLLERLEKAESPTEWQNRRDLK